MDLFNVKGAYLWAFGLVPPSPSISTTRLRSTFRRVVGPPPRRPCRLTGSQVDSLLAAGVLRKPHPRERAVSFVGLFPVLKKNGKSRVVGDEALRHRVTNSYPVGVMGPSAIATMVTTFARGLVTDARHYFYQLPIHHSLGPLFAVQSPRGTLFMAKALQGNRLVPAYAQAVSRVILREASKEYTSVGVAAIYDDWLLATSDSVSSVEMTSRMQGVADRFSVGLKEMRDAEGAVVAGCQVSFLNKTMRPDPVFMDRFLATMSEVDLDAPLPALTLWILAGSALWLLTAYLLPACCLGSLLETLSGAALRMVELGTGWDTAFPMSSDARESLRWACSLAAQRPHRSLHRLCPQRSLLVATDASTAAVAAVTEGWVFSAPIRISSRQIFTAEALTAAQVARVMASGAPGSRIVLFVDNEGTRLALRKFYARSRHVNGELIALYLTLCQAKVELEVRYVRTDRNPADVPTREPWLSTGPRGLIHTADLDQDLRARLLSRPTLRLLEKEGG